MQQYTVLSGIDWKGKPYWSIYDRKTRKTLGYNPVSREDALHIATQLNTMEEG